MAGVRAGEGGGPCGPWGLVTSGSWSPWIPHLLIANSLFFCASVSTFVKWDNSKMHRVVIGMKQSNVCEVPGTGSGPGKCCLKFPMRLLGAVGHGHRAR